VGHYLAFALQPIGAAWRQLDPGLEEAARIDGAGTLQAMRHVLLPVMAPTVLVAALLVFLNAFSEISLSALLAGSRSETLGWLVFGLEQAGDTNRRPRCRWCWWPCSRCSAWSSPACAGGRGATRRRAGEGGAVRALEVADRRVRRDRDDRLARPVSRPIGVERQPPTVERDGHGQPAHGVADVDRDGAAGRVADRDHPPEVERAGEGARAARPPARQRLERRHGLGRPARAERRDFGGVLRVVGPGQRFERSLVAVGQHGQQAAPRVLDRHDDDPVARELLGEDRVLAAEPAEAVVEGHHRPPVAASGAASGAPHAAWVRTSARWPKAQRGNPPDAAIAGSTRSRRLHPDPRARGAVGSAASATGYQSRTIVRPPHRSARPRVLQVEHEARAAHRPSPRRRRQPRDRQRPGEDHADDQHERAPERATPRQRVAPPAVAAEAQPRRLGCGRSKGSSTTKSAVRA
jgi:hypothetical protein